MRKGRLVIYVHIEKKTYQIKARRLFKCSVVGLKWPTSRWRSRGGGRGGNENKNYNDNRNNKIKTLEMRIVIAGFLVPRRGHWSKGIIKRTLLMTRRVRITNSFLYIYCTANTTHTANIHTLTYVYTSGTETALYIVGSQNYYCQSRMNEKNQKKKSNRWNHLNNWWKK